MTKTWYGRELQIGVLGGGQLGRMLIQAANSLDIQ
jgi:phosphoribosylaminoimidazole carboxylase (NCAIR synthetase)